MKKYITGTIVLVLLACLNSFGQFRSIARYEKRKAEGKSLRASHSLQGMFMAYVPFQSKVELSITDPSYSNLPKSTKTITNTQELGWLFSAGVGSYYNLIHINEVSAISLVYGFEGILSMNLMEDVETPNFTADLMMTQMRIGVPISLAFKHGGEVSYDKKDNFSFTLGAGMMPALEPTVLIDAGGGEYYKKLKFTSNPFVFTEIGIFAFIQWKLRMAMYPKGFEKFTIESNDYQLTGLGEHAKFTSLGTGPMFQLSLGFMPFSYGWNDGRW